MINRTLTAKNLGKRFVSGGRPVVEAIVLHDTAGSGTHNDTRYLANPGDGRGVSVDFTVERDGSVFQLNPDPAKFCTFHAGRATKLVAGGRVYRNAAVNTVAIGIEIVQKAAMTLNPKWPTDQVKAVAGLCFELCHAWGLDKTRITTHAQLIQDRSRTDPREFPFSEFWFHFNAAGAITPAVASVAGLTDPIFYTVVAGDSLWKIAKQFGTSIENLKSANHLSDPSNVIRPGQTLLISK